MRVVGYIFVLCYVLQTEPYFKRINEFQMTRVPHSSHAGRQLGVRMQRHLLHQRLRHNNEHMYGRNKQHANNKNPHENPFRLVTPKPPFRAHAIHLIKFYCRCVVVPANTIFTAADTDMEQKL